MKNLKTITFCIVALSLSFLSFKNNDFYKEQEPLAESMARGSEVYMELCISCHRNEGEGQEGMYPPLAKSDYLMTNPEGSIRAIKYGMDGEIIVNDETYDNYMAAFGLSDKEVADVMNYISNSWGNKSERIITVEDVAKVKE